MTHVFLANFKIYAYNNPAMVSFFYIYAIIFAERTPRARSGQRTRNIKFNNRILSTPLGFHTYNYIFMYIAVAYNVYEWVSVYALMPPKIKAGENIFPGDTTIVSIYKNIYRKRFSLLYTGVYNMGPYTIYISRIYAIEFLMVLSSSCLDAWVIIYNKN